MHLQPIRLRWPCLSKGLVAICDFMMASVSARLPTKESTNSTTNSSTSSTNSGALFSLFTPDEFSQVAPFLLAQSFTPAPRFIGRRQGCVFRLGVLGLGYYPDAPAAVGKVFVKIACGPFGPPNADGDGDGRVVLRTLPLDTTVAEVAAYLCEELMSAHHRKDFLREHLRLTSSELTSPELRAREAVAREAVAREVGGAILTLSHEGRPLTCPTQTLASLIDPRELARQTKEHSYDKSPPCTRAEIYKLLGTNLDVINLEPGHGPGYELPGPGEEGFHPLHDACSITIALRCDTGGAAHVPTPPTPSTGLAALGCCCRLLRELTAPHRAALRVRRAAAATHSVPVPSAPLAAGPTEEQVARLED